MLPHFSCLWRRHQHSAKLYTAPHIQDDSPEYISSSKDLQVIGDLVYLVFGYPDQYLHFVDMSDLANPRAIASSKVRTRGIQVVDDLVYVAGDAFSILRVHPELFGYFQLLPQVRR